MATHLLTHRIWMSKDDFKSLSMKTTSNTGKNGSSMVAIKSSQETSNARFLALVREQLKSLAYHTLLKVLGKMAILNFLKKCKLVRR